MPDKGRFSELTLRVAAFHISDKAMRRAQQTAEAALDAGTADRRVRSSYLASVRRYFESFSKEARSHLRDVDRRLERANQVHFNLTAERGVAVKRIEATEAILEHVSEIERELDAE